MGPEGPTGPGAVWDAYQIRVWNFPEGHPSTVEFAIPCPLTPPFGEVEVCWGAMTERTYGWWSANDRMAGPCCGHVTLSEDISYAFYGWSGMYQGPERSQLSFTGQCGNPYHGYSGMLYHDNGDVWNARTNYSHVQTVTDWTIGDRDAGRLHGELINGNGYLTVHQATGDYAFPYGYLVQGTWVKWQCHDVNFTDTGPVQVGPYGSSTMPN